MSDHATRDARRAKHGHAVQAVGAIVDADRATERVNPDLPDREVLLVAARMHASLDIAAALRDMSQALEKASAAIGLAVQSAEGWAEMDAKAQLGDDSD